MKTPLKASCRAVLRRSKFAVLLCFALGFAAAVVAARDGGGLPKAPAPTPSYRETVKKFSRPTSIPSPSDNQPTLERETLGRMLFFDPRLSGSQWISCATCHNPALHWGDGLPKGIGHGMKELGRRTPTILDLAWAPALFWDGRAESLEEQALGPIRSSGEMNMPLESMVARIRDIPEYRDRFAKAYPNLPVDEVAVAKAIACFERTVVSGQAPFDRWVAGDEGAISEQAKRGFILFNGKASCVECHSGWRFTDDSFHDIGLSDSDLGRGKLLPDFDTMQHAFKTPTLRNVDGRAPFMHDGSEKSLADVIELYDLGGRARRPSLAKEIKPLHLSDDEKRDLLAFLETLTSVDPPVEIPVLPR